MNSAVCVDANLALKLVLPENDSVLAEKLWTGWRSQKTVVIAPKLWRYEVTSVIRNRAHQGFLPFQEAEDAFTRVHQFPVRLIDPAGLHRRAWELAWQFGRPAAYDAHYLALAEIAGCPFWTADERLFNTVHAQLSWVHWLGHYSP